MWLDTQPSEVAKRPLSIGIPLPPLQGSDLAGYRVRKYLPTFKALDIISRPFLDLNVTFLGMPLKNIIR